MATHPSILAWRIPWIEEPGGLQSTGSQKLRLTLYAHTQPAAEATTQKGKGQRLQRSEAELCVCRLPDFQINFSVKEVLPVTLLLSPGCSHVFLWGHKALQ